MLYLNDAQIRSLGTDWHALTEIIEYAVQVTDAGDYSQPLKPYLRYGNPRNRIIAMPAYLGGRFSTAGLKWVASFPGNRDRGKPRAHCVIVLNEADTGEPAAVLNGARPNVLRTAAVSALMLRRFLEARKKDRLHIGIIGWGPVGRAHYEMCVSLFGSRVERFHLTDIGGIDVTDVPEDWRDRTEIAGKWEAFYDGCDVLITCTVADQRYIDRAPPAGSVQMDVSLRDYNIAALQGISAVIVDDWEEVCRENTDIELLHRETGLTRQQTLSFADVVCRDALDGVAPEEPVLFCPMGMAVFDMAIAHYLVAQARSLGIGTDL